MAIVVRQMGVDVVVEVRGPDGALLDAVDSPTGRTGDEPVELVAERGGTYRLVVRPYDQGEPEGRYRLTVMEWRNRRATAALLAARAASRDSAAAWLAGRTSPLVRAGGTEAAVPALDALAARARVMGLGEATHGSRELADTRLALTQYLVSRQAVRLVALEQSASRVAVLDRWAGGEDVPDSTLRAVLESGWIGRRTLGELVRWLRAWNSAHPAGRVRLVGLDPQDNARGRAALREVVARGYSADTAAWFRAMDADLAAADSQALVFGDSGVDPATRRSLFELMSRLDLDAPLLAPRVGAAALAQAREAAAHLAQMADFNATDANRGGRSRDAYMAANLLRALAELPPGARAVFWAHNAHVAAPPGRQPGARTSGAWLRDLLGCEYAAVASSFGQGGFVAQRPNDPQDRLEKTVLPPAPAESVDSVMGLVLRRVAHAGAADGVIASWSCGEPAAAGVPRWLGEARALHWVGGLYEAGSPPSAAFRPFDLLRDFDGVVYLPRVNADEIFLDRPLVPARRR
ncbi:MAG TPA: erythromycin esterase family protein [Longimicrobium sp.]